MSLGATWEEHCANYRPGRYSRDTTPAVIASDAGELAQILLDAHHRLNSLCGSIDGYVFHVARNERPCEPCRQAWGCETRNWWSAA